MNKAAATLAATKTNEALLMKGTVYGTFRADALKHMAIQFHFDFVSPYAFIAWTRIHAVAERHQQPLEIVPVLFAGLLEHHGQKGPAEIPAKRVYTYKDAWRKAVRAGIRDFRMPPAHPFNPLVALRVTSLSLDPDTKKRVIDVLYRAAWQEGAAIDTPEAVTAVLTKAGFEGKRLVREAQEKENKDRLRKATEDAVARGVFGVPTAIVDGEVFWGSESLELLEAFLRGEDPIPNDYDFAHVPVAADRKGHLAGSLAAAQQRKPVE